MVTCPVFYRKEYENRQLTMCPTVTGYASTMNLIKKRVMAMPNYAENQDGSESTIIFSYNRL
jgi:hypothetical protein